MKLIKAGETVAARRRVHFQLVDATDLSTPELGEAGGQPQISINGAAFADAGIGVLVAIGNGRYYATVDESSITQAGYCFETRYKSAATDEAMGEAAQVVAFDPFNAASLGLSNLDVATSTINTAVGEVPSAVDVAIMVDALGD